jgi:hypothetical protein
VVLEILGDRETKEEKGWFPGGKSGAEGDRTPDLVNAIHALSQLSYSPATSAINIRKSATKSNKREGLRAKEPFPLILRGL